MTRRRARLLAPLVAVSMLATLAACAADPADGAATTSTATATATAALVDIGAGLRGPSGLTATALAAGPANMASFAVDDEGRLWAGTASYSADGSDGVYLVTAGAAVQEVVTGLSTVLGLSWVDGTLYVASAGRVDAYSAFDGTSFADRRTVLTLPAGVGEVNGIVAGSDGRLRLGISSPCDACTPTDATSASVVSFLPDGTDLRVVASGIHAPVGLAFYPGTDTLFVTMNQRDDLGEATPGDWLSVVADGQSWGFPGCYGQGGSACAGTPTPVAVLDAHAAVSAVAIVTGQLGATVGTAAVVAEWSTGTLMSVPLDAAAPATASTATTFVTGIGKPVAVTVGADGALYAADWASGTIYRITQAT